jgi:flagellar protein FlaG
MPAIDAPSIMRFDTHRPSAGASTPAAGPERARQEPSPPGKAVPALPEQTASSVRPDDLSRAVVDLNDHAAGIHRNLEFTLDEELNRVIVRVYDAETEEIIRQIPAEEVLRLARHIARREGIVLDAEA